MSALGGAMAGLDCRALPFTEDHRTALKAACAEDQSIWPIYSVSLDPDHFDATIDALLKRPDALTFVLFDRDELAGMSSYLRIDERNAVLEIGFTYYRPHLRGTGLNRRIKDMMIAQAFAAGFRRIEFRVDRRNARSQAACRKLGFVREGIRRADTITWTGHVRDTVVFSVLPGEWPV